MIDGGEETEQDGRLASCMLRFKKHRELRGGVKSWNVIWIRMVIRWLIQRKLILTR
ncbi:hypothetical protein HanIR_Chr04g0177881 [Helianthus annuus]|nr:hypothetical protein HanIR_Chr04g0177881 [Helianthus annuus]